MAIIAPSLLSADFSSLKDQIRQIEPETEWLHLDVMDGNYVPNISIGFPVIKSLRRITKMFFDTHLMVEKPERFFSRFLDSGSDLICFHPDATRNPAEALGALKRAGCKIGMAINNRVSEKTVLPYLSELDLVLVMGVQAGFGAQQLVEKNLEKVSVLKKKISEEKLRALIEFDGGVTIENCKRIVGAGADVLVAGSAVFGSGNPAENIRAMKKAIADD